MTGLTLVAMGCLIACSLPATAQENNTYIQHATRFAISPPLRDLAKSTRRRYTVFIWRTRSAAYPRVRVGPVVDRVEQSSVAAPSAAYTIGANILGVGNGFPELQRSGRAARHQHGSRRHPDRSVGQHFLHRLLEDLSLHLRPGD